VKPKPKAPPPLGKLSCNIGCLSRNRAIVPKTQVYQLAKSLTSIDCLRNAYLAKKGFQFYQWVPGRSECPLSRPLLSYAPSRPRSAALSGLPLPLRCISARTAGRTNARSFRERIGRGERRT